MNRVSGIRSFHDLKGSLFDGEVSNSVLGSRYMARVDR
jgi:hypothetical protein